MLFLIVRLRHSWVPLSALSVAFVIGAYFLLQHNLHSLIEALTGEPQTASATGLRANFYHLLTFVIPILLAGALAPSLYRYFRDCFREKADVNADDVERRLPFVGPVLTRATRRGVWLAALLAFFAFALVGLWQMGVLWINEQLGGQPIGGQGLVHGSVAAWAAISIYRATLGPVLEELLFRWLLYGYLRRYSIAAGAIISGALFGLAHSFGPYGAATMGMGIVLALAYEYTGSLRAPILLHVLNNTKIAIVSLIATVWS